MAIQTGRGLVYYLPNGKVEKRNLSPANAVREARRIFGNFRLCDLNREQTFQALEALTLLPEIKGAAVHDFMHVRAAEHHDAQSIVT